MEAAHFIDKLNLKPHPEGGYFSEIYRNNTLINAENLEGDYTGSRNLATSIYFMLAANQVSKLHRLTSDELWYFHYGSPLLVHVFYERFYTSYILGPDVLNNESPQIIIKAGAVFGAEVIDKDLFTLMGCMVTPGFHFSDFKLIAYSEIITLYPEKKELIKKLT